MDSLCHKSGTNILQGTHGTFSRIDHIFGHQTCLKKRKKAELLQSIFSDQNIMKIEINKKEKQKIPSMWKFSNTLLKYSSQK